LADVLSETVRQAHRGGASVLSLIVSRQDRELLRVLRGQGFMQSRRTRALYLFTPTGDDPCPDGFALLNCLATDLAYRFPMRRDHHLTPPRGHAR
jgi:hypothetical protein